MKLTLTSKARVFIQPQFVTIVSVPWSRKINKGARLTKNASLTAVFTWEVAQCAGTGCGLKVVRIGRIRRATTRISEEAIIVGIANTWICTKSFWFLKPTDGCYPLKAGGGRVSLGV